MKINFQKTALALAVAGIIAAPQVFADQTSGAFAGVQIGRDTLDTSHTDNDYWYNNNLNFGTSDGTYAIGLRGGYNWVSGQFIGGVLAEISKLDANSEKSTVVDTDSDYAAGSKFTKLGSLRGRAGITSGDLSVFLSAGLAWAPGNKDLQTEQDGSGEYIKTSGKKTGRVLGFAAEYALNKNSFIGLDYSHYKFGSSTHDLLDSSGAVVSGYTFSYKNSVDAVTASYNYKF